MTKKDLKAGYTLEDEKGNHWLLFETQRGLMGRMIKNYEIWEFVQLDVEKNLENDLTFRSLHLYPKCDIVKVYDIPEDLYYLFNNTYQYVRVLWERPKTKKSITFELTEEQIEKVKKCLRS